MYIASSQHVVRGRSRSYKDSALLSSEGVSQLDASSVFILLARLVTIYSFDLWLQASLIFMVARLTLSLGVRLLPWAANASLTVRSLSFVSMPTALVAITVAPMVLSALPFAAMILSLAAVVSISPTLL